MVVLITPAEVTEAPSVGAASAGRPWAVPAAMGATGRPDIGGYGDVGIAGVHS
jgi:hypothetical protein